MANCSQLMREVIDPHKVPKNATDSNIPLHPLDQKN